MTDKGDTTAGHAYGIAAYRPTGALLGGKTVTIAADGTMAGSDGLMFVAFTGGYLQALVKKAGRYDAKADVRGGTQIAVLDVLSGKTGPGRNLPDIPALPALRREARPRSRGWRRSSARTTTRAGWSWSARARSCGRWRCRRSSRSTRRRRCSSRRRASRSSSRSPSIR